MSEVCGKRIWEPLKREAAAPTIETTTRKSKVARKDAAEIYTNFTSFGSSTLPYVKVTIEGELLALVDSGSSVDFLRQFGMNINFSAGMWSFDAELEQWYKFEEREGSWDYACSGLPELTSDQVRRLEAFLKKRLPVKFEGVGVTSLAEHRINIGQHAPIRQRCYLVSSKVQEAIRSKVDEMLAAGVIEPSNSEWSNPIIMVKKPNGKYRFCLDFRKVNEISKTDAYLIPNMIGILDKLLAARYILTLDLSQAYFQIPLAEDSREVTAFRVPGKRLFHFKRMPYSLTGAPATFQPALVLENQHEEENDDDGFSDESEDERDEDGAGDGRTNEVHNRPKFVPTFKYVKESIDIFNGDEEKNVKLRIQKFEDIAKL
ncbi:PREDICTED: uncharacterized protein LOC106749815, partial [Dinoponera quadriceps]|uniref:Uncharacterized protein LOC106749815 n=1 Tax=Dinoponera quadriceps TaxID=609295 RepID=A0A6P3Y4C6_DINQU